MSQPNKKGPDGRRLPATRVSCPHCSRAKLRHNDLAMHLQLGHRELGLTRAQALAVADGVVAMGAERDAAAPEPKPEPAAPPQTNAPEPERKPRAPDWGWPF